MEGVKESDPIDIWYGCHQIFGKNGLPQRWINILGNVLHVDELISLKCSLNGNEERQLNVGPDTKRLKESGDFNADIHCSELDPGVNRLKLTAVYKNGLAFEKDVSIEFHNELQRVKTYSVDWNIIDNIQEHVQIVDGKWERTPDGLRTSNTGYDRIFSIGDMDWRDYEVKVPVTIHGFDKTSDGRLKGGLGLLLRWNGHYYDGNQPYQEWRPNGTIAWYRARWEDPYPMCRTLNISDAVVKDRALVESEAVELMLNTCYIFKFNVKTHTDHTSEYRFEAYPEGYPENRLCNLSISGRRGESRNGSLLVIAYHTDVTIGNIECRLRFP
jgi:hypothetical protein